MLHDAVIMQLIVTGEAALRLSPDFRAGHPEIDWTNIVSLGHGLAHGYWLPNTPDDIDGRESRGER